MFSPTYGGGYGSGGYGFAGGGPYALPVPGRAALAPHPATLPGTFAYQQVGLILHSCASFVPWQQCIFPQEAGTVACLAYWRAPSHFSRRSATCPSSWG